MKTLLLLLTSALSLPCFAQWSSPVNLSPGTTAISTNEYAGQCIAVTGDTLRITYIDRSSSPYKVMYAKSTDQGLTWSTPVSIHSSANAAFTAIATSGSNVHIVWMDFINSINASFYRRSLDGGNTWQPTVVLDSVTKFWPGIACTGDLVIATLNKDVSGNTEVFVDRSLDNGATWLAEQRITNAPNRSEDPAICMNGNDVHLSWNDKRNDTMNIYYCHSADGGATWEPNIRLSNVDSYTSQVCANGKYVDVAFGLRPASVFDTWLAQSADTGSTFKPNQNLTNTPATAELAPFLARDGDNLHICYSGSGGFYYVHSTDGGTTWDAPLFFSSGGQPFIVYTGCTLHIMYGGSGHINYVRNPTGNCISTGTESMMHSNNLLQIYPNPATDAITIALEKSITGKVQLYNSVGALVFAEEITAKKKTLHKSLDKGIYFVRVSGEDETFSGTVVIH